MMNSLIRLFLLTFLALCSVSIFPQDAFRDHDRVYGLDPMIYNGRKYSYFLPSGTGGNQFFTSAEFMKGGVVVKGVECWDLLLNYDIFNQKLLLKYYDETGAEMIIEVSEAWLERFSLGKSEFTYLEINGQKRIFQVLGDGPYFILYSWRKKLDLNNSVGAERYVFSEPARTQFVMIDGEVLSFGSKASFIKLFKPEYKVEHDLIKNEFIKRNDLILIDYLDLHV